MKYLSLFSLMVVFVFSCIPASYIPYNPANYDLSNETQEIDVSYDLYNDATRIITGQTRVFPTQEIIDNFIDIGMGVNEENATAYFDHQIYLRTQIICLGDVGRCKSENITMWFESFSTNGWTLLENSRFIIVYDGERYVFQDPDPSHSTISGSSVLSQILVNIPYEIGKKIADSKDVKVRLGTYELDFSEEELTNLQKLYQHNEDITNE